MGEGKITKIVRKKRCEINNDDAVKDGLENLTEFDLLFRKLHPDSEMDDDFDIITWEWTKKEAKTP